MPCRPTTCDHLQCFDASLFLMMNEKKPTWTCPVCDSPAKYDDLMVDGYFQVSLAPFWSLHCAYYHSGCSYSVHSFWPLHDAPSRKS